MGGNTRTHGLVSGQVGGNRRSVGVLRDWIGLLHKHQGEDAGATESDLQSKKIAYPKLCYDRSGVGFVRFASCLIAANYTSDEAVRLAIS